MTKPDDGQLLPINEVAFDIAITAANLGHLCEIDGNREILKKLFATYETVKAAYTQPTADTQGVGQARAY